jgi:release factor glutamine methyltransferase
VKLKDFKLLGKILNAIGDVPKDIYYPSDDSFLILSVISELALEGKEVLDMGTGSGLLGLYCAMRGAIVTVADVDEIALHHTVKAAKELGVPLRKAVSDLFSNVHERFDLVLFNPPYLPTVNVSDRTVDGGSKGRDLIDRFLSDLPKHMTEDGTAILLVSSLNDPESLIDEHPEFRISIEKKCSFFFEELQVLNLRLREDFTAQ